MMNINELKEIGRINYAPEIAMCVKLDSEDNKEKYLVSGDNVIDYISFRRLNHKFIDVEHKNGSHSLIDMNGNKVLPNILIHPEIETINRIEYVTSDIYLIIDLNKHLGRYININKGR